MLNYDGMDDFLDVYGEKITNAYQIGNKQNNDVYSE